MNRKDVIKQFILSELVDDPDLKNISDNDPLIEPGYIDSLGIMKLLSFLEESFDIRITDEDLVPENFESVETIFHLTQRDNGLSREY